MHCPLVASLFNFILQKKQLQCFSGLLQYCGKGPKSLIIVMQHNWFQACVFMICAQLSEYEPSTSLTPVCLYINVSACWFRFANFNLSRYSDGSYPFSRASTFQCVYLLHLGNSLFDKSILDVSAPIENVPVYFTKISWCWG